MSQLDKIEGYQLCQCDIVYDKYNVYKSINAECENFAEAFPTKDIDEGIYEISVGLTEKQEIRERNADNQRGVQDHKLQSPRNRLFKPFQLFLQYRIVAKE